MRREMNLLLCSPSTIGKDNLSILARIGLEIVSLCPAMDNVKFRLSTININGWNYDVSVIRKLNKFVARSDYVQVCCINYIGSRTNS